MQIHSIKTTAALYNVVKDGSKTFDVRNDDRAYQKGDIIELRVPPAEFLPPTQPGLLPAPAATLPPIYYKVGFVLSGGRFGLAQGYVAFSLVPLEPAEQAEINRLINPMPLAQSAAPATPPADQFSRIPGKIAMPSDADFAAAMENELNTGKHMEGQTLRPPVKR